MTALGEVHVERIQAALPLLYPRLRTKAVFEEQEPAGRFQRPVHFAQGLPHVLGAAQRKRADGAIEGAVLESRGKITCE
jgi:hypothetical protein